MPENKTRNTANVTNLMWHHKYSLKQDREIYFFYLEQNKDDQQGCLISQNVADPTEHQRSSTPITRMPLSALAKATK